MTADTVFDRLARRPATRVTTRLSERFANRSANGRCCRVTTRLRERFTMGFRRRNDDNNEKKARKQRRWLDVFAATNRFWQCISALILYGIYTYFLMSETSGSLPDQTLSSAIEALVCSFTLSRACFFHLHTPGNGQHHLPSQCAPPCVPPSPVQGDAGMALLCRFHHHRRPLHDVSRPHQADRPERRRSHG